MELIRSGPSFSAHIASDRTMLGESNGSDSELSASLFGKVTQKSGKRRIRSRTRAADRRLINLQSVILNIQFRDPVLIFQIPVDHVSCRGVIRWRRIHACFGIDSYFPVEQFFSLSKLA